MSQNLDMLDDVDVGIAVIDKQGQIIALNKSLRVILVQLGGSDLVFTSKDLFDTLGISSESDNEIQRIQKGSIVLRVTRKSVEFEGVPMVLVQVQDLSIENRQLNELHHYTTNLLVQIRSRITPIQNALTLFLDYPDSMSREELQGLFGISAQELWQTERWLDNLRDISLLNSGSLEEKIISEDLHLLDIIQSTLRHVKRMMTHNPQTNLQGGVQFECNVAPDLTIRADNARVIRTLEAIIINAILYCERVPKIIINAEEKEGHTRLSIHDNGIGIPPEEHPHIFEYGFRGSHALIRGATGLGMDLWLSRSLLSRMGATLEFTSVPGMGSTFVITFQSK